MVEPPGRLWSFSRGQHQALQLMERALHQNRMPHAWLLHGPTGVGKRTLFYTLAALLLGPHKTLSALAACPLDAGFLQPIWHHSHTELYVEEAPLAVESLRLLKSRLQHTALTPSWRVVALCNVHLLNLSCANALLKLLEAPPPSTVFILTATSLAPVPWTIQSRCLMQPVRPLCPQLFLESLPSMAAFYDVKIPQEAVARDFLCHVSQGCLGRALALLQEDALSMVQVFWSLLEKSASGGPLAPPPPHVATFFAQKIPLLQDVLFLWMHGRVRSQEGSLRSQDMVYGDIAKKCGEALEAFRIFHTDVSLFLHEILSIISLSLSAL